MSFITRNTAHLRKHPWKILGLMVLLLLFASPDLSAQNTKGDKPAPKTRSARDTKFKIRRKQGDKAKTKDIAGRRLRTKNTSSANKANANYPVPHTARKSPKDGRDRVGQPLNPIRSSRPNFKNRRANVYPQFGKYQHNPSRKPDDKQRPVSNKKQLAQLKKSQSFKQGPGRGKSRRIRAVSASKAYISHKSINPFAGFWNKKQKGEKAYKGDISGRRLRTKNFETKRPPVIKPSYDPYYGRKKLGDKPYKGPAGGGYISRTRTGRAWKGDISGRRIRGRNYSSKRGTETVGTAFNLRRSKPQYKDRPYKGKLPTSGFKGSATKRGERAVRYPISGKTPGIGARGINKYQGNIKGRKSFQPQGEGYTGGIKSRRPFKGGGSVSGKLWNNNGRAIPTRPPGAGSKGIGYTGRIKGGRKSFQPQGEGYSGNIRGRKTFRPQGEGYTGNIKGRKTFRPQGEEYSGNIKGRKTFRPQGEEYTGNIRYRKTFRPQGEEYTGNIKGRKTFRPQGEEYTGNIKGRKTFRPQGEEYSGNIKGRKTFQPQGEEYSGNIKGRKTFQPQGEEYSGNIKARRPAKGGGSVSGKLWNNKERPIEGRSPGIGAKGIDTYSGNIKGKKPEKGGGSVSGKLWNNNEKPIEGKSPGIGAKGIDTYAGNTRLSRFKKNYVKNPNQADEALKKKRPSENVKDVDNIYGRVKQYHYVRNQSGSKEALKVREPGKAFGRANDYQGNIKMKKFELFKNKNLHPDAQFVKTNKNNVKEERGFFTNIKLWWGRMFRKNETQPDHLKEKLRKPRYDKGEQGMWYD